MTIFENLKLHIYAPMVHESAMKRKDCTSFNASILIPFIHFQKLKKINPLKDENLINLFFVLCLILFFL